MPITNNLVSFAQGSFRSSAQATSLTTSRTGVTGSKESMRTSVPGVTEPTQAAEVPSGARTTAAIRTPSGLKRRASTCPVWPPPTVEVIDTGRATLFDVTR